MDRVIQVAVNGGFIRKDSKSAGVRGEANVTTLHITMSEDWRAFSKRIVWRDALGEHPVAVALYNSVADLAAGKDPLVFDTLIPAEPLDLAGWCSFTIEGFREGEPAAVAITVTDRLEVQPNDAYEAPAEPTPTQAQQLQGEIDAILPQVTELVTGAVDRLDQANEGWAAREQAREDAEKVRQDREAARVRAEEERVRAENARKESETAREDAEEERAAAEEARAAAEQARADEHTGLIAQATRINEATAAALQEAERAAQGANAAQEAAQTAQGKAQEAQGAAEQAQEEAANQATAAAQSAQEAQNSVGAAASQVEKAKGEAEKAAQSALSAAAQAEGAAGSAQQAGEQAQAAAQSAGAAQDSAAQALQSAQSAQEYSGKPPEIRGENWWVWSAREKDYVDTGKRAVMKPDVTFTSVAEMETQSANWPLHTIALISSDVETEDNAKMYIMGDDGKWRFLVDLSGCRGERGVSITSIQRTAGDGSQGTADTYTITLSNGESSAFQVYNGRDGDGRNGKDAAKVVVGTTAAGDTVLTAHYLCDGANDDAQIAAAIASLTDTGGTILFREGTYQTKSIVTLAVPNVTLLGESRLSRLATGVSVEANGCAVKGLSSGSITISQAVEDTRIEDVSTGGSITFRGGCKRVRILNCDAAGMIGYSSTAGSTVPPEDIYVSGCAMGRYETIRSKNAILQGNIVRSYANIGWTDGLILDGCHFGGYVRTHEEGRVTKQGSKKFVLSNNTISGGTLRIYGLDNGGGPLDQFVISDNIIDAAGAPADQAWVKQIGMEVSGCMYQGTITGNTVSGFGRFGMRLGSTDAGGNPLMRQVTVTGNHVAMGARDTSGSAFCTLHMRGQGCAVTGNVFRGASAEITGDQNTVVGNVVTNAAGDAAVTATGTGNVVKHNIGQAEEVYITQAELETAFGNAVTNAVQLAADDATAKADAAKAAALRDASSYAATVATDAKNGAVSEAGTALNTRMNTHEGSSTAHSVLLSNLEQRMKTYADRVGSASVPAGCILLWSGAADAIPEGWRLCDGTNGTPDLRDRFVVGAGGAYISGTTGGAASVTLAADQLPSHTHAAGTLQAAEAGAHTHGVQADGQTPKTDNFGDGSSGKWQLALYSYGDALQILSAGAHTHTLSGVTGETGNGEPHENRPPYYALCFIMKL